MLPDMRAALFLAMLLTALGARSGLAFPTSRVTWFDCGPSAPDSRTFACDTNDGSETLYATFTPDTDVPGVASLTTEIDVAIFIQQVPSWWNFGQVGDCRNNLPISGDVSAGASCRSWSTAPVRAILTGYSIDNFHTGYNVERIRLNLVPAALQSLHAGVEVGLLRMDVPHAPTVGSGACSGCESGLCIELYPYVIAYDAARNELAGWSIWATAAFWQGGTHGCEPDVTPARRSSWGAIKSLYR